MNKPEYLSKTYYDVVIRDGNYLGWYAIWVGDGSMEFRHQYHGDKKFTESGDYERLLWMKDCWEQFVEYATQKRHEYINSKGRVV